MRDADEIGLQSVPCVAPALSLRQYHLLPSLPQDTTLWISTNPPNFLLVLVPIVVAFLSLFCHTQLSSPLAHLPPSPVVPLLADSVASALLSLWWFAFPSILSRFREGFNSPPAFTMLRAVNTSSSSMQAALAPGFMFSSMSMKDRFR